MPINSWEFESEILEIKTYVDQIWHTYDHDKSGTISYDEAYDLIIDTLKNLLVEMEVDKE